MSIGNPVFWRNGMFLQPQHFQLSELSQTLRNEHIRVLTRPWFWGAINLKLASQSLAIRVVDIEQGEFLFQDGTIADIHRNAVIQSRTLKDSDVSPDEPLNVYVGVRKLSTSEPNVSVIHSNSDIADVKTRFYTFSNPTQAADVYQSEAQADVQLLTLKLSFILEHELERHSDYHVIQVGKITYDGDRLAYIREYIPPVVNLSSSDLAYSLVRELRDELAGRAFQLSNITESASAQSFDPNLLRYRFGLQALARYTPRFFHLVQDPAVSPWDVYGFMRELIGEVSMFSRSVNFLGEDRQGNKLLEEYRHDDIWGCFNSARTLISQMLNEISVGPQFIVEFDRKDRCFEVVVPSEFFEDDAQFFVILNTEQAWETCFQSFTTTAKLADADMVETLIERSLPGIGLFHMPGPPPGLPKKAFANYARIDTHDEKWKRVSERRNLALLWDEAPADLNVELVILRK